MVALQVLGEQDQMIVGLFPRRGCALFSLQSAAQRDVDLAADDRFDALLLHRVVERDRAIHIPVIGHRAGRHSERRDTLGKRFDLNRPIEQAVVCMQVQVNEILIAHLASRNY
jgi:hypothetical protein